jgi:hypothetical protein
MPRVGFVTTATLFERAKILHAVDRTATVIDRCIEYPTKSKAIYIQVSCLDIALEKLNCDTQSPHNASHEEQLM